MDLVDEHPVPTDALTTHLMTGELGAWFADRMSNPTAHRRLVDHVEGALKGHDPIRPPPRRTPHEAAITHWAIVQRLAFAVEPAPPYYALLGAHLSGLVDVARAHAAAGDFPTHTGLGVAVRIRRLDRRPTPAGWIDAASPAPWKSYHDEMFGPITLASHPPTSWDPDYRGRSPSEVLGLCSWLSFALRFVAAPGQLADPASGVDHRTIPVTETGLAAACTTLAGWEHAYRTGRPLPADAVYDPPAPRDGVAAVRATLNAADPATTADVAATTILAVEGGSLEQLRSAAGTATTRLPLGRQGPVPFGFARPVLVPHWADAPAIIGDAGTPGGTTLLTVETPVSPPETGELLSWCHRLLALRWLDGHNSYRVGHLALYLARHGALITWPARKLAAALAGTTPNDLDRARALRGEFRALAHRAIRADGADPRWIQPPTPGTTATTGTHRLLLQTRG